MSDSDPIPNAINTRFLGFIIKKLRDKSGLTQQQLADRTASPHEDGKQNMDHSYISQIERGNRVPTFKAIGNIAEGLGLEDPAWLIYMAMPVHPALIERKPEKAIDNTLKQIQERIAVRCFGTHLNTLVDEFQTKQRAQAKGR